MSIRVEKIRARLDELGARREQLEGAEEALRQDTRAALRSAKGVVPIAEAARRVKLNRSTVYELYMGARDDDGAGNGKPSAGE